MHTKSSIKAGMDSTDEDHSVELEANQRDTVSLNSSLKNVVGAHTPA